MRTRTDTHADAEIPDPLIHDLGRASVQTLGPYAEGPIEIMGHRAPIGLSDD